MSSKILLHDLFREQCSEIAGGLNNRERELFKKQLGTAYNALLSNPRRGDSVKRNKKSSFRTPLLKIDVGGSGGYRLFYFYISKDQIVVPVYITTVKRGSFKYSKNQWLENANIVREDFRNSNSKNFKVIESST